MAAIDCGTHSTRLLIDHDGTAVVRLVELTRLGEGLADTGSLQPQATARVYAVLEQYRRLIDEHEVVQTRIAATSAARDAANGADFVDRVGQIVGVPAELLDGSEEAALTFLGATAELDPADGPFLVVDIGGGSTEFAFGTAECEAAMSLDIGSVRLSEIYIEHDPPAPDELSACITVTGAWLEDVEREMPQVHTARTVVGVAGTVATAVAVEIGLPEYDRDEIHHFTLTREAAEDVFRTLATEDREQRAWNPGLPEGRVDTIVGGMSILVKTMRHFDLPSILASESDILDGLVRSMR